MHPLRDVGARTRKADTGVTEFRRNYDSRVAHVHEAGERLFYCNAVNNTRTISVSIADLANLKICSYCVRKAIQKGGLIFK